MKGKFIINGKPIETEFQSTELLLDLLRNLGFSEVKEGCREGECGSCVVSVDNKIVNSCKVFAASVMDLEILTVKGLGTFDNPHPLQTAFVEAGAVQCGYCTPAMILSANELLRENKNPGENEIRQALDGNLCRCTGYVKIIDAVKLAAERMTQDD